MSQAADGRVVSTFASICQDGDNQNARKSTVNIGEEKAAITIQRNVTSGYIWVWAYHRLFLNLLYAFCACVDFFHMDIQYLWNREKKSIYFFKGKKFKGCQVLPPQAEGYPRAGF